MEADVTTSGTGETGGGRLLLDCTRTALHGGQTGVQRVVRNLVAELCGGRFTDHLRSSQGPLLDPRDFGFEAIVPVAWDGAHFRKLSGRGSPTLAEVLPLQPRPWVRRLRRLSNMREARVVSPDGDAAQRPRPNVHSTLSPRLERILGLAFAWRRKVVPAAADTLLLLDPPWNSATLAGAVTALPCRVGTLFHDVVPMTHPETCSAGVPAQFRRFLGEACRFSDFVVTVSHATAENLRDIAGRTPGLIPSLPSLHPFPLATTLHLEGSEDTDFLGHARLREIMAGPPMCIAVGTIEPRKNHHLLLDGFERLWAADTDVNLLVIGRVGWSEPELLDRLNRHPERSRRLYVMHNLSDDGLRYAYRYAAALVAPAASEGFGLPLLEARAFGCPVIASDIPPHREAGGSSAAFFEPGDAAALAAAVQGVLGLGGTGPVGPNKAVDRDVPDWRAAAATLLREISTG